MIPIDAAAMRQEGHFIRGDIESFVSPIDGAIISGRKQYEDHCRKHGVVNAAEFSPEYYAKKKKARDDFYAGVRPRAEIQAQREHINEVINFLERQG